MKKHSKVSCSRARWHGRQSVALTNGAMTLHWLLGGGHLASVVAHSACGNSPNFLFEAPWKTIEPYQYSAKKHSKVYGPPPEGSYLAGYQGHVICLDYFGIPSREESEQGLPLHGELPSRRWGVRAKKAAPGTVGVILKGEAPIARLTFERDVTMYEGEAVAYVKETVVNRQKMDRYIQWVQHATFGPPFFAKDESVCAMPASRCLTGPYEYEGMPALPINKEFSWPMAPAHSGGQLDISKPFTADGRGFVATVLLETSSAISYMAVLNWKMGRVFGYCYRTADYPWVVFWEENRVRQAAPWKGLTQARGLEFGNTPTPEGMKESVFAGRLFGVPRLTCLPAKGRRTNPYLLFAAEVPTSWRGISKIEARDGKLLLTESPGSPSVKLDARGVDKLLSGE